MLVDEISVAGGGAGFTTSIALARLGAEVFAAGAVGSDDQGGQIRRWLDADGVDTRWLRTVDAATSSTVVVVSSVGERSYLHASGASSAMRADLTMLDMPGLLVSTWSGPDRGWARRGRRRRAAPPCRSGTRSPHVTGHRVGKHGSLAPSGRGLPPVPRCVCPRPRRGAVCVRARGCRGCRHLGLRRGAKTVVIHAGDAGAYVGSRDFWGGCQPSECRSSTRRGRASVSTQGSCTALWRAGRSSRPGNSHARSVPSRRRRREPSVGSTRWTLHSTCSSLVPDPEQPRL